MTKNHVAQRIRELAAERDGHVSLATFLRETGIKGQWLRTQTWYSGWNKLLEELGVATKAFSVPKTSSAEISEAVANLILRDGQWPTEDALARERRRDESFPSLNVIRPFRKSGSLARLIVQLGDSESRFSKAAEIAAPYAKESAEAVPESSKEKVRGYVYMLRSGRRYKIGKSTDPSRRWREVRLELPEETIQVHSIPTDDPTGIESYWHQRFAAKRVRNTEFFELDADDVHAFKRRSYQ